MPPNTSIPLNMTPSDYDLALLLDHETFNADEELAMFTNTHFNDTQFFDFDLASQNAQNAAAYNSRDARAFHGPQNEFVNTEFAMNEFNQFNHVASEQHASNAHRAIQPNTTPYHGQSPVDSSSPSSIATSRPVEKRRIDSITDASATASPVGSGPAGFEDSQRMAAEEDKRRRNTAASARFRVKKKQREQALEKTAKEMTDRVNFLENRVGQLQMENKLLKDLLTEKSGKDVDVDALVKEGTRASDAAGEQAERIADVKAEGKIK